MIVHLIALSAVETALNGCFQHHTLSEWAYHLPVGLAWNPVKVVRALNVPQVVAHNYSKMDCGDLPKEIINEVRQVYTDTVIDHAMNPRNVGEMESPDGFASITGPCGDVMEMWIRVRRSVIEEARFWTSGCASTIAAGSITAEMATGMSLPEVQRMNAEKILIALGGLPEENKECAIMAANTLKGAVKDYLDLQREPWKKQYKRQ